MKKKIPLTILEFIQPIAEKHKSIIKQLRDPKTMFHLVDNDEDSDFFFRVTNQENRTGALHYLTEFKPQSKENVQTHTEWVQLDKVASRLNTWIAIINGYNTVKTVFDDPILKSYEDNFLSQIDIIDDNADEIPFDLKQQLYLDEYLAGVDSKLENLKQNKTADEVKEIDQLQEEAKEIKKEIPKLTKRKLVKRLARFWAKSQKVGVDVIKEIFVSVTAEIAKRLLTGG